MDNAYNTFDMLAICLVCSTSVPLNCALPLVNAGILMVAQTKPTDSCIKTHYHDLQELHPQEVICLLSKLQTLPFQSCEIKLTDP